MAFPMNSVAVDGLSSLNNQPQAHPLPPNYNSSKPQPPQVTGLQQHIFPKSNPTGSLPPVAAQNPGPIGSIGRAPPHPMAQQLLSSQAHARSQRMVQQHQQQQQQQQQQMIQQQRLEEMMMTCEPLDCYTNRNLALRRYTNHHIHMNSVLGTHWTVKELLRDDHISGSSSKRRPTDRSLSPNPPTTRSVHQRKEHLQKKLVEIEKDIKLSELSYRRQVERIESSVVP